MTRSYVICPEKITGPFASSVYPWMPDNAPCDLQCPVVNEAEAMHFRCPRGHRFYATPKDIHRPTKEGD